MRKEQVLKTRKKQTMMKLNNEKSALIDIKNSINRLSQSVENIEKEIRTVANKSDEIIISEHAILRYIERAMQIDMDGLVDKILSQEERKQYKSLGNMNINKEGYSIKVVDGIAVTILSKAA